MPNLGLPEFFVMLVALPLAAIPVCTFVLALLTYRAVKRIEERLNPPS